MQSDKQICLSAWGRSCRWLRKHVSTGPHFSDAAPLFMDKWYIERLIYWRKNYFEYLGIF